MGTIEYPKDGGGPAMPVGPQTMGPDAQRTDPWYEGMSLRTYAAIQLGVPDSDLPWLDVMIRDSLRIRLAGQAMQGILFQASDPDTYEAICDTAKGRGLFVATFMAQGAIEQADALLAKMDKMDKKEKP